MKTIKWQTRATCTIAYRPVRDLLWPRLYAVPGIPMTTVVPRRHIWQYKNEPLLYFPRVKSDLSK